MPVKLRRLLEIYSFLSAARIESRDHLQRGLTAHIERSLDATFLEIMKHESDDLDVTLTQTRFLMTQLVKFSTHPDISKRFEEICEQHLRRLTSQARQKPKAVGNPDLTDFAYLDSLSDRIAIFDAEYRYTFTNKANATFHGEVPSAFAHRPNWQVTGEKFFEAVNKPRFDKCLAGHSSSYISPHPNRDPSNLYLVNIDPVRADDGTISSVIMSCRDLSMLPVPQELIVPQP